jgi:hypothetical protein
MTTLVERLRQGIERGDEVDAEAAMDTAAAEIERLRAALLTIINHPDTDSDVAVFACEALRRSGSLT